MTNIQDQNHWTTYWNTEQTSSCLFLNAEEDEKYIDDFWKRFARTLISGDSVLDLATGNGYVVSKLFSANSNIKVSGVDSASIKPQQKNLVDAIKQEKVKFFSDTDISKLPFDDNHFSAATSQFGLEYITNLNAYSELARVLKAKGTFCFLMHNKESELIQASAKKFVEMNILKRKSGLLDYFRRFILGEITMAELQTIGGNYLQSEIIKTQDISQNVFSVIEQVVITMENNKPYALQIANEFFLRFESQYQRLKQMLNSAKSDEDIKVLRKQFDDVGLIIEDVRPFHIGLVGDKALFAWQVRGHKI